MIEMNKKRIINLLTIVVLLLSYSGIWAQSGGCDYMPDPVAYTQVSANPKLVKEYADVKGVRVTRTLKAGTRSIDKVMYSNQDTTTPAETYCSINRQAEYGGKKYPFMDSNKVVEITYEFSKPVVDVEVFLAAFGYSGTPQQVGKDQIDDVKFAVNKGSLTLHPRSTCTPNAIEVVNGNEVKSKKRVTTDAKVGITSTESFTQLTLTYHEPGGSIIGGAGFYVEICLNSIQPLNRSICSPDTMGNKFTSNNQTKTLNGVDVGLSTTGSMLSAGILNGETYCTTMNYSSLGSIPFLTSVASGPKQKLTYTFDKPITSAEIFLFAFGESTKSNADAYDEVKFAVNGGGAISLSQTYNCNPEGTKITGNVVRSADDRKITTNVGIKVSSTQPFTEIVLEDNTPHGTRSGNGYLIAICESSIKLADISQCNPGNINNNFTKAISATETLNGVEVERILDANQFANLGSKNYCGSSINYPANLPYMGHTGAKKLTYKFKAPVTSAEIFLFAFGESEDIPNPNRYDEVKFSVNGGGTMTLSQTYNCMPTGTTINSSTGKVRSADNKLITTDVGIKVTSTQPFTEIVLDDLTPSGTRSGMGYVVEICASSITKTNVDNFIKLDATASTLTNQTVCEGEAPTYKAKATAKAFATTAKFDYVLEAKKSGATNWVAVETKSDVAPGTEHTFTGGDLKTTDYNNAKVRVKYVYKNSLFPSVTGAAYSNEATLTVKEKASITSLTASPTSLNETGATNIVYTIKGTPGATVTYRITGDATDKTVNLNGSGVATVPANGQTTKTTLTITKVEKTGLCSREGLHYKAEVDREGSTCTSHPTPQFAKGQNTKATLNGVEVTRTMEGTLNYYAATTYPNYFCTPTIMEGHPIMNDTAINKITYTFAKPITKVQVWLSGFGGTLTNSDSADFAIDCSDANLSLSVTDCNNTAESTLVTKSGNRITSKQGKYFQAIVQVTADKPFTKLIISKGEPNAFRAGGYLVELCPSSVKPAKIKVTQNPAEMTACVGATGKRFTARAKIDGVAATESMSYIWQQSPTPNVSGSWVTAVASSPGGSVKVDASTEAGLTLGAIQNSHNGLYYRAKFTFTKCSHTLETVYSEPAKLNVPSTSDIITITAPTQGNITTSDCTASTQVSVQAKVTDGYTIKNNGGGNLFGYFLQYKENGTWKDHATQKFSNNANDAAKKLIINHGQTASGTVFRVRYTVTLTTGCEYTVYSSEFTFTKNLPAAPAITTPQTFCQSENKTVGNLTILPNIKWYDAASGGNEVLASTLIPVGNNNSYWATITTNGCESDRKEVIVKVEAKPNAPTVQNKTECPATGTYDMKNLVTSSSSNTLKWYAAATGNATTTSTVDRHKTAKTTYEKWVAQVTPQGCESDRVKVTYIVDVTTQPTITAPAASLSINCADPAATTDAAVNAWAATATATVGCGTNTVTNNYATVKPADLCSVGEIEVTFTVTDAFGTQKTVKKKITVDRLIANNDTESVARSTGKDIDVLSNDTVNGAQATTSNAKVTLVSDGGIGATVTSDGKIRIPGGSVAPGTYNVTYKICDKNNPSRCGATATVAVTVNNSTIEANHDTPVALTYSASAAYAKAADNTDFNVLSNDKLSGVTPTLSQVDILPTNQPGVTIEASTGKIKVDGATAAGVYNLTYKIKEKNTTNTSATANVTVVVKNALVVNPATLTAPITPSTSATTPKEIGNVLNQTQLNGSKPNASQVSISVTQGANPPVAGDPVPSIDPATGKVLIPSGVKPGNYTIKYKVCDKATGIAKSCSDEKTITVNVAGGNTTTTNNDDFTANPVERSNSEEVVKNGANPVNVLANDKLGTRTNIDTDVVTIRQTATSNSGVNIDTATGQIKVAANTPAGVHEVKYKITEKGQTTESSEATAKVVVKNKVELDPATIPGTVNTPDDGNDKTIANILDKAKINGNKPDAADVVITVPNPAHKDAPSDIVPYVDTTTGKVIVPVGTKPGNHQITYQVCDKLPAGQEAAKTCKTATITIPVAANSATSADDDYASNPVEVSNSATSYVKNGTEDVNVLSNDALGSNTTITTNLVDITQTHTSHSGVNIETATGKVKVAPNTPAGEYTLKYTIAEKGGGPSSAESTVKVVVKNKLTLGSGNVPSSVKPATGNTPTEIGDVLNGTKINGTPTTVGTGPNQVTITVVTPATPQGSNPVPTLDPATGKVKIPAGVPAGSYTIKYKICDNATPASAKSCEEKTLDINVVGNNLTPIADDFSTFKVEKPAANTFVNDGTNDVNVLTNDKLGDRTGLDTNVVTINQTYTSDTSVNIDLATGKVKVGPGATAGEHTIRYALKEKGQSTESAQVTVKVTVTNKVEVNPATIPASVTPSTDTTTPKEIGNVLNQTTINGNTPTPAQVTITETVPAPKGNPSDKVPYIDPTTGKVVVPAGVKPGSYPITYKVCDKALGAANTCKTATITVNVAGNTITPDDDDFSAYKLEHPTVDTFVTDGTNPVNILTNDKLGARTGLTTNLVTITPTVTNPNVSIDTDSGKVKVKANAPAGVYTVKYKITEKGQTTASAEKTVTVVVTNKLVTNNGNYGGAPSTTSTPADGGNVLDNVRINGATTNPAPNDVTITVDQTAGSGIVPYLETSGADKGKIKLPQGTPSGTYTIKYTVCDNAPAAAKSCKQATATVVVDANAIIATNDTNNKDVEFNANTAQNVKAASNNDLNVLDNDKLGATTGLNNTQVTIQTTQPEANITIQPDGKVQVAAGKAAGVYELKYKIKDNANPTNISGEATVKVVVKNKLTFDPFLATPVKPSTDNNTPADRIDVLDKTKLNGNTPAINDVTIQVTDPADPQSPDDVVPELDTTTGKIKVPAGVKPGTYTIEYKVCDKVSGDAKTCKTNSVTFTVAGNDILAVADDFTAHKVERSTSDKFVNDGTNDVNVLTYDKLGTRTGLTTELVTINQTHTSEPKVTIEPDGRVKVAADAPAGTHTIKYRITEKGQTTASNEVEVKVVVTNKIELDHTAVISNPVTPSTDSTMPKKIGDVLDGIKLNGAKPTIGTGPNQVTITVTDPADPQVAGDPVPEIDTTTGEVKIPAGVKPGTYNITYKVCDNANPQTCETSTVPITVQGNTTTSADDDFTAHKVVHPTTDTFVSDNGTPVNVLSNDKLGDDDSITTDEVEIIQTATTNPKVSIDTATGKVKVEANTPAGEYTVKYKFKEKGQSDTEASQEKTVTVVVTNQVEIDRANNNYTGAPSINATPAEGGDVLDKVKINGNKPNANEVNITVDTPATGTTVPYLETSGADAGKIKIPQGTPAGTYTITYTVCDKAQPASARTCEQATATITVDANPIVANADNDNKVVEFSTAAQTVKKTDGTTLNVLANDKLGATTGLNNTIVTIETTQPVTDITIKANGEVEVGANKAPGVYELKYKIRETADPTHVSAEATVKVVVKNKVELDAIPTTPANPSTDGRTPNTVVDILDNTKINGNKPNANEVTIEVVTPATPQSLGDIVPTIDTTTGKVVVPSGVKPGTYTITYKVCDKAQPDEAKTCKTDTVTITVTGNTIQATADDFTAHKVERSNNDAFVKDGANEVNVLTNDELGTRKGIDTQVVTITQTTTPDPKVTIDTATGKVKVAANAPAGEHVLKYTITEKGQTTASQEVEVKVVVTNKVESEDATYTGTTPTDSNPTTAGNILDHVHFNGGSQAPDPSEVTVEIVTPAPGTTVPTIITTGADTGKIQIPQGTPAGTYPITYKVCDKATGAANTCKTHTATVTVNPATTDIVAQPDTYTLQWDAAERTAEGNILVNDRHLTRENLDTTLVDIQQVAASTPDKVSIDTATGKVKIAAGTPAGTHTISYTITPKGETSPVSAPALVTVVIKNKVELATNPINGAPSSDDTPREIGNVIDNVKINGQRPDPSDVTIEITPATPLEPGRPTPEVDPATGKVTVPKNTPSGEYTIGVKVCDKDTPKTCVNQNITIKVRPDQDLMAEEDEFSVGIMGGTTPSVLRNDKLRGRTGLTIADVTVQAIGRARAYTPGLPEPASDRIIVASDGRIDVKEGLQEGDYIYEYSIISKEDTNLISNTKVIIHVTKNVAAEDEIEVEKPREGEADNTSTKSLLDNDAINGQKPIIGTTPGTVTIEKISVTPSAQDKIDIDTTTGKIIVKPGAPIGEHEVEYRICLNGTLTCKTGKAKVKIQPQLTLAEDNFADRTIVTNISTNQVGNVLANDTLDGQPIVASEVSIKVTNNAGIPGVTIDAEGNLTIPQGAPSGTHTIEYEIISNTYGVRKTGRVVVNLSNDADLEFYNAISTDEGSQNNGFIIKNIELYPKNNLKIFNRYGVLIFEKDGYTNASPFKGISEGRATVNKDGKLPQGTYYYILEYIDGKNQTQQKAGWLYIK